MCAKLLCEIMMTVQAFDNLFDWDDGVPKKEDNPIPPTGTPKKKWIADPLNSKIKFKIKHLQLMEVEGEFKSFVIVAYGEPPTFQSLDVSVEVEASGIDTGDKAQDTEVKSLFNTLDFPLIKFKSNEIEWKPLNEFLLYGELTIKDKTLPITLEGKLEDYMEEDPMGLPRVKFSIEGDINRKLFGIVWESEKNMKLLSNNVNLIAHIELTPPKLMEIYKKMNIPLK